jgi:hypothetical protein
VEVSCACLPRSACRWTVLCLQQSGLPDSLHVASALTSAGGSRLRYGFSTKSKPHHDGGDRSEDAQAPTLQPTASTNAAIAGWGQGKYANALLILAWPLAETFMDSRHMLVSCPPIRERCSDYRLLRLDSGWLAGWLAVLPQGYLSPDYTHDISAGTSRFSQCTATEQISSSTCALPPSFFLLVMIVCFDQRGAQ